MLHNFLFAGVDNTTEFGQLCGPKGLNGMGEAGAENALEAGNFVCVRLVGDESAENRRCM